MCGSVKVGGGNSKSLWLNDGIKAAVKRNEAAYKEVLVASSEGARERCMEAYREETRKVKEQFGRKMNEAVNGNMKLFWKELRYAQGGKVES